MYTIFHFYLPVGWSSLVPLAGVPKGHPSFDKGHDTIERRSGYCRDNNLGPDQIKRKLPNRGGDAKAHAQHRRAEEFSNDGADQGKGGADL